MRNSTCGADGFCAPGDVCVRPTTTSTLGGTCSPLEAACSPDRDRGGLERCAGPGSGVDGSFSLAGSYQVNVGFE